MLLPQKSYEEDESTLSRRYYRCDYYGNCYSAWYSWGRFVVIGAIILVAIVVFIIVACITARRRRKRGAQPMYGTGWMANQGQPQYGGDGAPPQPGYGGYWAGSQPAPPYGQPPGAQANYYGPQPGMQQQTGGIEMQSPPNTYQPYAQPGDPVYGQNQYGQYTTYAPPTGPPPGKVA